jgi:preprotein translocase SecE subunit
MNKTKLVNPQKIVFGLYIAAFALFAVILNKFMVYTISFYELEQSLPMSSVLVILLPVLIAGTLIAYLFRRQDLKTYLLEATDEINKISFPDRKGNLTLTVSIFILIAIATLILLAIDALSNLLVNLIVNF